MADAAASTIQPTLPSDIPPADAVSSPANATASSPPEIALNNTVLENPAFLDEVAESALLDKDDAVLANNTSELLDYKAYCWSSVQIPSIQHPVDCYQAVRLIYEEGPALTPVTWSRAKSWTSGTCALLLVPESETAEDVFFRLDIVSAVTQIQHKCMNSEHGFRGGHTDIGPLDVFHVAVEAKLLSRN